MHIVTQDEDGGWEEEIDFPSIDLDTHNATILLAEGGIPGMGNGQMAGTSTSRKKSTVRYSGYLCSHVIRIVLLFASSHIVYLFSPLVHTTTCNAISCHSVLYCTVTCYTV